jgi:hypothetical protein
MSAEDKDVISPTEYGAGKDDKDFVANMMREAGEEIGNLTSSDVNALKKEAGEPVPVANDVGAVNDAGLSVAREPPSAAGSG